MLKCCFYMTGILLFYGLGTQPAFGEGGHHDSHVHGIALINVALEKSELYIELESPAANIVGFEHAPSSEKEKKAVKKAFAILKTGEKVFKATSSAGVTLENVEVTQGHELEEHGDPKHGNHDTDHHEQDKDAHDEDHSEFKAVYRFHCKHPDKLKQIEVMLFEQFKGIEEIEVQVLTETGQKAMELTPQKNRIIF